MISKHVRRTLSSLVIGAALAATACGEATETGPALATPTVTLNHTRVPAASPVEITYKFVVAPDAKFTEDYRVFVHVVDTDEELMWNDDHDPPVPTTKWQPGQRVEYTRTIFVPVFPYVGDASIQVGLHSTKDQRRIPLSGEDVGQRSYRVVRFQLLPQTDNLFTVFKDGWHPAETVPNDPSLEWQWTRQKATLAFKNPKKDAVFFFDVDSPGANLHETQQVTISLGGQAVQTLTIQPDTRELYKINLPAAQMGDGELSELVIDVDKTFVPAVVSGGTNRDPRELGVRVFHAFIDPR